MIETYRGVVYPWHCDQMGHMNVMWYVGKFDEATWNLFAEVGITTRFLKETAAGWQRCSRTSPTSASCSPADTIAVRSALLEVRDKVARFVHEMRNAHTGEISAICVLTGVSMDSQTRKSTPFPGRDHRAREEAGADL
jgi:acyl-CoA thioester hydrolase